MVFVQKLHLKNFLHNSRDFNFFNKKNDESIRHCFKIVFNEKLYKIYFVLFASFDIIQNINKIMSFFLFAK